MPMAVSSIVEKTGGQASCAVPLPQPSWEDMEYGGLSLSGIPSGAVVKNTFIDYPTLRSSSLDDYTQERGWKSCPNSGIMDTPERTNLLSELQSLVIPEVPECSSADDDAETATTSIGDSTEKELGELPEGTFVKNTFIDCPAVRSPSLDDYMEDRGWKSCPVSRMQSEVENQISSIQAAVIAEAAAEALSGSEEDPQAEGIEEEEPTTLRLLELLPRPEPAFSLGSIPHQMGQPCKPCGFVHKPEGCSNGANCQYCHLCPPGTIKERKKVKKVLLRQVWQHRSGRQGWY